MMNLGISRYKSRYDKGKTLDVQEMTWRDVVKMLTTFKVTPETFDEYSSLDSLDKLAIKDVGYFVGGVFAPPLRKACNLKSRSVLALDLDHLESWDVGTITEVFGKLAFVVHSSHSHSEESPRLRIVFPFTRDVRPAEYEPIARRVAAKMGMDYFDDTTYQFSRVMFLPSHGTGADYYAHCNEGHWLDPDKLLATYEDWGDFGEWPQSSREIEKGGLRERKDKASNPFEIPGVIGAFNRAYPIDEAILEFELPYEESGKGDDRYSYAGGSSADGAVFYRDDGHLFSHHESDPAQGNRNAWDLCRLHRFADLDEGVKDSLPIAKYPSQKAMVAFAETLGPVLEEWDRSASQVTPEDEFEDVVDSDTGETVKKPKAKNDINTLLNAAHDNAQEDGRITQSAFDKLVLRAAAGYGSGAIEEDDLEVLADYLRRHHPSGEIITKAAMMRKMKIKTKALKARGDEQEVKDIQMAFLDNFESEYYYGGERLRRAGRVFWEYTGTHWRTVEDELVNSKMLRSFVALREDKDSKKEAYALKASLGENTTSALWNSLRMMFQSMKAGFTMNVCEDKEDPMGLMRTRLPAAINCDSGEIHFDNKGRFKLTKHKPEHLFGSVIPVKYDKKATCPTWDRFCRDSFRGAKDPEGLQRHLEEMCGYILNRSRRQRCWALMYGPTGSGKSTVGALLTEMMGSAAKTMSMSNYDGDNTHATAGLIGKQLLLEDDFSSSGKLNDSFVKMNSEEKRMGYNPKGGAEGEFVSRAIIVICSNNPPRTSDVSGALYDRALVFPFKNSIPREKRDNLFLDKLVSELPGIFLRFVRGMARLNERGDWLFPVDCSEAWETWKHQSNPLPLFLAKCYVKSDDPKAFVPAKSAWATYQRFLEYSGIKVGATRNSFYTNVDSVWSERIHKRVGDGWPGYTFIPDSLDDRTPDEQESADNDFDDTEEWDT